MDLTGGGAFYSLTPKSDLADLQGVGLNKIKRKSPLPLLLVCSRLTGLRARLSALTLRPQLASRFTKGGKIPAFTLAEVLVTLGVIGVVAAMTLPMLAKNYQFYVRQQQFKKAYAALEIAVQKTQIDLGEGVKCHYLDYFRNSTRGRQTSDCGYFYNELIKNLQLLKKCEGKALEHKCIPEDMRGGEVVYAEVQGGDDPDAAKDFFTANCSGFNTSRLQNTNTAYIFNPGIMVMPYPNGNSKFLPLFIMDINAHKGPNKWGHDIFVFIFDKRKKTDSTFWVGPVNSCHPIDFNGYYTTQYFNYLYRKNTNY